MEAHRSYERFERGAESLRARRPASCRSHATQAAFVVALMAAFLAVAAFLSNEAVKEVMTGETHRADATARLEVQPGEDRRRRRQRRHPAGARCRRAGRGAGRRGGAQARGARRRGAGAGRRPLRHEIDDDEHQVSDADTKHFDYELAEVGLEVGIVLASVSIIVRRRWLLGAAGAIAAAGVVLLVVGLTV